MSSLLKEALNTLAVFAVFIGIVFGASLGGLLAFALFAWIGGLLGFYA